MFVPIRHLKHYDITEGHTMTTLGMGNGPMNPARGAQPHGVFLAGGSFWQQTLLLNAAVIVYGRYVVHGACLRSLVCHCLQI
jgi:hypothetical protein